MSARTRSAEPLVNAPGPVLIVAGAVLGGYLLQTLAPDPDAVVRALGLTPVEVAKGRLWPLLTVMIVHGSWTHAGLNALGVVAFGTPVARRFGRTGALRFLAFYVLCGLIASIGYVVLHWGEAVVLVGASGAISGLMGATSRLLDRRETLAPFASRAVIAMAGAWLFINLLMAMRWIDIGVGDAPVAWEAHLVGYGAGLLLIGPFTRREGGWRAQA